MLNDSAIFNSNTVFFTVSNVVYSNKAFCLKLDYFCMILSAGKDVCCKNKTLLCKALIACQVKTSIFEHHPSLVSELLTHYLE